MFCRRLALVVALVGSPCIGAAAAQGGLQPAGVDLGVGLSTGKGAGLRRGRDGIAASATVTWRGRSRSRGAVLVAVGGSAQTPVYMADDCLLTPSGGCAPDFPGVVSIAVLGGWEARSRPRGAALRLLAGPALAHSAEHAFGLGVQGRVDVASAAVAHVAFVGWVQGTSVPRLHGTSTRLGSAGLGLRLQ